MPAHRHDITPAVRIQLASRLISSPEENRSELARRHELSRPSLYAIEGKGRAALEQCFDPAGRPLSPGPVGFWLWVDANAIKRAVVTLRAVLGAPLSAIVVVLQELFGLRLSEASVRAVVQEGYQRAFEYQKGVRLDGAERVAFDEMYRWSRCILTGVDCESLFIFLGEKQPGCGKEEWTAVMGRLREQHGLEPQQVAIDGLSALANGMEATWPEARLVHDIAHAGMMLKKVRAQFEQRAYQAIEAAETMKKRHERGPTRRTSLKQLDTLLSQSRAAEQEAIERAALVARLVEEAYAALAVIDPHTGCLNDPLFARSSLLRLGEQFKALGTTQATWTGSYLLGPAQKMVEERAEFGRVLHELAQQQRVPLCCAETAAWLWQVHKQYEATTWSGTREQLEQQMQLLWGDLRAALGPHKAAALLGALFVAFRQVLAASSPIEWANERLSAVLPAQKRASSGMLHLRAAFLNLHRFVDGRRRGHSPHELLTGEQVGDWLVKLGYAPRSGAVRSLKKLGWPRLVEPFEPTWRQNWLGCGLQEALCDASELLDSAELPEAA
jgi:hypothetical protein